MKMTGTTKRTGIKPILSRPDHSDPACSGCVSGGTGQSGRGGNVFKQLRLNMWVSSLTRFIPEHIYDLGNQLIDMETLKGRDCYGGLTVQHRRHHCFELMFRPEPRKKNTSSFFWIPENTIPKRVRRASVPYDVWYQQGYLMATGGMSSTTVL